MLQGRPGTSWEDSRTLMKWDKSRKGLRKQQGCKKGGVVQDLINMSRAPGIKRTLSEEKWGWQMQAEEVQWKKKEEPERIGARLGYQIGQTGETVPRQRHRLASWGLKGQKWVGEGNCTCGKPAWTLLHLLKGQLRNNIVSGESLLTVEGNYVVPLPPEEA